MRGTAWTSSGAVHNDTVFFFWCPKVWCLLPEQRWVLIQNSRTENHNCLTMTAYVSLGSLLWTCLSRWLENFLFSFKYDCCMPGKWQIYAYRELSRLEVSCVFLFQQTWQLSQKWHLSDKEEGQGQSQMAYSWTQPTDHTEPLCIMPWI